MRMLHVFEEEEPAYVLVDTLFVEGIEGTVRDTREGHWALWVHDEERMGEAKALLEQLLESPDDPRFDEGQREADARRAEIARHQKRTRHREIKAREKIGAQRGIGTVTIGLIGLSVGLYVLTELRPEIKSALTPVMMGYGNVFDFPTTIAQNVMSGELWRLVMPMFIHGGLLHLVFNMLWLKDFGTIVERAHSPGRLVLMTLVFGVGGILGELALGITAVGMSGVVFGLFAYIWTRGRYDPSFRYSIDRNRIMWLMGWYLICFFIPGIANGAHTAGLVLGGAWGFLASGHLRRKYGG